MSHQAVPRSLTALLENHYGISRDALKRWVSLANHGGFSGAELWRFTWREQDYCLRRWPTPHPDRSRLEWIHSVLERASEAGVACLPLPVRTRTNASVLAHSGHWWEVQPWLSGRADFCVNPSSARLRSIVELLARFHQAVASHPHVAQPPLALPSSWLQRHDMLCQLRAGQVLEIEAKLQAASVPVELKAAGVELIANFRQTALDLQRGLQACRSHVPIQPCIRDLWHDHVLFEGDTVSGIVDFGAMNWDTVATDLARLLGSLLADDREAWETALAGYQEIRPLSDQERALVSTYDRCNPLLSGINWIRWIVLEGRHFADKDAVLERIESCLQRVRGR